MIGGQDERPLEEQAIPAWKRDAMDRECEAKSRNDWQNPAIMELLRSIDHKLDELSKSMLRSNNGG